MGCGVPSPPPKLSMPAHDLSDSFLHFAHSSPDSRTRVAIIYIQFSSVTPSLDRRLFLTAFNGPSLNGPNPLPPKMVVGPPARYTPPPDPRSALPAPAPAPRAVGSPV